STPRAASERASSTTPVLSETESRARRTAWRAGAESGAVIANPGKRGADYSGTGGAKPPRSGELVLAQLLAQGAAVDAERGGGAALVAVAVLHHFGEQRRFDFVEDEGVQVLGRVVAQVAQVAAHHVRHAVAQRRLDRGGSGRAAFAQCMDGIHV